MTSFQILASVFAAIHLLASVWPNNFTRAVPDSTPQDVERTRQHHELCVVICIAALGFAER